MGKFCSNCGNELVGEAKFCPACGTKVENHMLNVEENEEKFSDEKIGDSSQAEEVVKEGGIQAEKEESPQKETKKKSESGEFWPSYTDDKYRNGLVKSVRVMAVVDILRFIICVVPAWKYKEYYGWGWMIGGTLIGLIISYIALWVVGADKYFGEKRLQRYDYLVETAGQSAAVVTMETKKGGIIRKALIVLIILCMFGISENICYGIAIEKMQSEESTVRPADNTYVTTAEETESSVTERTEEESQAQSTNFQIGDVVSTNLFEFTVTNAYVVDDLGETKKIPEGAVYVAIEYSFKNISKQPISSWDLPDVKLVDGNDAIYSQDADADWYFDSYSDSKIFSDMNPGIRTKSARIFEVAIEVLNAGGMRAYVKADQEFLIDLPLSYGNAPEISNEEYLGNVKPDDYYMDTDENNGQSEYILPDSSSRYLSPDEVSYLSKEELRLARNEVYARHGRKFQSEDLNTYFSSKSWYQGYISAEEFDEGVLNEYEKANLDLIKSVEAGTTGSDFISNLSGEYEMSIDSNGGAYIEIQYFSGEDAYYATFYGSYYDHAGETQGYLIPYTDGTDNIWEFYPDYGGNYPSMRLAFKIGGVDIVSLDGDNFGGMNFPGFAGYYTKTKVYPLP